MRAMLLLLILLFVASPLAAVEAGEAAPDFSFERTWNMGSEQSLSSLRGQVVLLEYWASW